MNFSTHFRKTPLAAAIALCSTLPAFAAEPTTPPADASNETVLKEVKVEANAEPSNAYKVEKASSPKLTQPLLDTPKSVQVVTQEAMREQGVTSLRDALRNISGISMAAGEGGVPAGDNLTLRGFSARTDLFIDGVRDIAGYNRDSFNLETVEVSKGPGSALTGRGSTGGSVNLVSKSAKLDRFTSADLSLGTDNLQRLAVDTNQTVGENSALRVNLLSHSADVPGRDVADVSRWALAPSLAFGLETDTRLTLSHLHQTEDNMPDYGIPYLNGEPANVDRENYYGLKARDFEDITADISTVKLEHDFSKTLQLRNQLRYGEVSRESIITAPRMVTGSTTEVNRTAKQRDTEDSILVNQTDLTIKFDTGSIKHTVVTGLELAHETYDNNGKTVTNGLSTPLDNPNPNDPFTGTITPGTQAEAESDSLAVYLLDTAELSEQWLLSGGLRFDKFETDYETVTAAGVATPFHSEDDDVNGQLGLVYKPQKNGSIYLSYGTSINPSAEGLTLNANTENLDPEESKSYELGTKWEFLNQQVLFSAAVFRTDKTNARTPGLPGEAPTVLNGEQRVDGYELSLSGVITDQWQAIFSYTHLDGEILKSNTTTEVGNDIANVAPETWSMWLTYKPTDSLQFGLGSQYVDVRYNNAANLNQIPDYTLIDAMAAYQLTDSVLLRLNINNATDEEYYGTVGGGHTIPGAGRLATLTASFTF